MSTWNGHLAAYLGKGEDSEGEEIGVTLIMLAPRKVRFSLTYDNANGYDTLPFEIHTEGRLYDITIGLSKRLIW